MMTQISAVRLFGEQLIAFSHLHNEQLSSALLRYLDEGITSHILHSLVSLVHKLKEFGDDRFKEAPVGSQEPRVLSHDVHDVASDNGLVILAALVLTQTQEVADHHDEEGTLVVLLHGARDAADGPAEGVEIGPGPLGSVDLAPQFFKHNPLRVLRG